MPRYPRSRFIPRRRTKLLLALCALAGALWFFLPFSGQQATAPQPAPSTATNTQVASARPQTIQANNVSASSPVPSKTAPPAQQPAQLAATAVAPPKPPKKLPGNLPKDVAKRLEPQTQAQAYPSGPLAPKATFDRLVLKKKERRLYAYYRDKVLRVYPVALGQNPQGHRKLPGDKKTPEGIYAIRRKDEAGPYYKTLELSFPNAQDLLYAQEEGRAIAGPVGIHGLTKDTAFLGPTHRASDWTDGGIALSNEEIDELFTRTPLGVPVHIQE